MPPKHSSLSEVSKNKRLPPLPPPPFPSPPANTEQTNEKALYSPLEEEEEVAAERKVGGVADEEEGDSNMSQASPSSPSVATEGLEKDAMISRNQEDKDILLNDPEGK